MTKYKINNANLSADNNVTLTSFMNGENANSHYITNPFNKDHPDKPNNMELPEKFHSKKCGWVILNLPKHKLRRNSVQEKFRETKRLLAEKTKKLCSVKTLKRRVPITAYLPKYDLETAVSDFVAGLTVGLTIIPQAIAYSSVAGLPAQIGLYSSFVAPFVYAVFGSSKDSPVGPTAIEGLLTRENVHELGPSGAVLLCFLSGCVELLMGILNLGFLIDFISGPVAIGFTSAAAIIIATTQVKDLLGLDYPGENFLTVWGQICQHITDTSIPDCTMGCICIVALLILKKTKDIEVYPNDPKKVTVFHKTVKGFLWLVSTSRNLLVVVISASISYAFEVYGKKSFQLTGFVKPGLPDVSLPPFSTTVGNVTYDFVDMASTIGSGIIIVPLLSILQNYAIAKVYCDGKAIDSTQEMLALGICNVASSFVSSMPVSGALSRGAVNHASGVKTTFGGVYTGIVVILSLRFLTPWFYYIPKSALAAVIIVAVSCMVELHTFKPIWKTNKIDLIPAAATFFVCLLTRLEIGISVGVAINLSFLLYAVARPTVYVEKIVNAFGCEYVLITPDRSLYFPSVENVRSIISKAGTESGSNSTPLVIDARHIQGADFTAAKGMKMLMRDFNNRNQPIIFVNLKRDVVNTFQGVGPKAFIHCQNIDELNDLLKTYSMKPSSALNGVESQNQLNRSRL
ncbi:sodium-independent sulfate anion transporter-like isoform X1 [Cylas formicarius]|uniref:sodium-independent sulfate anion transporter-like isoform X1 n=1 Tax=Cylas formicarius TaxID=197179 RepID=UPI0029585636|nr:sodium-independent sulfate anion transporter-like isoform X1 [Cylas formicarius]